MEGEAFIGCGNSSNTFKNGGDPYRCNYHRQLVSNRDKKNSQEWKTMVSALYHPTGIADSGRHFAADFYLALEKIGKDSV